MPSLRLRLSLFLVLLVPAVWLVLARPRPSSCLCLSAVLLIVATASTRARLQNAFLTLACVVGALGLLEVAGDLGEPVATRDLGNGLLARRLVVGWGPGKPGRFRAQETSAGRVLYDVHYTIDQRLLRAVEAGTDGPATVFFGDSFIFGHGVNDDQTMPQLYADLEGRRLPLFNLAFEAYSPAQTLAMMQVGENDDLVDRAELLAQFVAPWHAERVACRPSWVSDAPRYVTAGQRLRFEGLCPKPRLDALRFSAFYRSWIEPRLRMVDDADVSLLVAITKETIRLANAKYHKPMVILYQADPDYLHALHWTDDAIMAELRGAGAEVFRYNLPDAGNPRYSIAGDKHPTGLANQLHARALGTFVRQTFPTLASARILRDEVSSGSSDSSRSADAGRP